MGMNIRIDLGKKATEKQEKLASLLRIAGFRATPGRIELLEALAALGKPVTVAQLEKKLKGKLNAVTLYRALEALAAKNLIRRVDLQHDHAHYEFTPDSHHHHAVCKKCGLVEDIEVPHSPAPEKEALKASKKFSAINTYSLEFFGLCKSCS